MRLLKTLGIDTSSLACSCAVVEDGKLLAECYLRTGLTHSRTLTTLMRQTLSNAGCTGREIDRVAVSAGPGSYTGLRIGVATAKGFAMANHTPCVGVSTLLSLAQNAACHEGIVCSVLDARAGQVYAALFERKDGSLRRLTDDDAMKLSELAAILPEGALAVGDGARLLVSSLPEKHLIAAPEALCYQRASSTALLAESMQTVPAALLLPDYHRKPQAEREREARLAAQRGEE